MQLSCAKQYVQFTTKMVKEIMSKTSEFCHVINKITDHENEAMK